MSTTEANKEAIAKNRKTIFSIESEVLSNKALVYQSRSMIEENRLMIMSNYSAAFMGNRQLANANTDEIFSNRTAILQNMDAQDEVQQNYIDAQTNKSNLDFLKHRSALNASVLEVSKKMADINAQLVAINREIMDANKSIVEFNATQISANSDMLGGSLSAGSATPQSNADIVAGNTAAMAELTKNISHNRGTILAVLETSEMNAAALMKNKDEINERRVSIMENRKGIADNKAKIG
jgi:hypothetical protein